MLEAPYDVGEPRQGGVRPLNERRHPQGVLSGLREHRKDKVLEVGQPRVPTQLGVTTPGEQLHHPRRAPVVRRDSRHGRRGDRGRAARDDLSLSATLAMRRCDPWQCHWGRLTRGTDVGIANGCQVQGQPCLVENQDAAS